MNADHSSRNGTLPWTRSCFVCGEENPHGLHLRSQVKNGRVFLDYTTRDTDRGYRHIVHGGILMTLLDEVMTWAAILAVRRVCVAAEMTTRLKRPVKVGDRLHVEAWTTRVGTRLILTEGSITDMSGAVLLTAEGKYMPMPADQIELTSKDFVDDPAAIPHAHLMGAMGTG